MSITTGRNPLDDAFAAQLRATLDAIDTAHALHPGTMPPWDRIQHGMRWASRQRRRRFTRLVAIGTALLLGAGVAALVSGLVPRWGSHAQPADGWPDVPEHRVPGHSLLYSMPTKGSLRDNTAWLGQVRERIARRPASAGLRPPSAQQVKILFAGDLGAYRLVLAEGDWTGKGGPEPLQLWLQGPAGAGPGALVANNVMTSPQDVPSIVAGLPPLPYSRPPESSPYFVQEQGQLEAVSLSTRPIRARLSRPRHGAGGHRVGGMGAPERNGERPGGGAHPRQHREHGRHVRAVQGCHRPADRRGEGHAVAGSGQPGPG